MKSTHLYILYVLLALAVALLFASNILFGSVSIPFDVFADILSGKGAEHEKWGVIITASRFPQAVTALLAGAALAVSGLMLQTLFNNPLADPSILGVSSGAGLGVALVMLLFGINGVHLGLSGYLSVVAGGIVGAMVVLGLLILFSMIVKSNVMLLVVGIMVGYIASSVISLLNFYATESGVISFVMWGMGDFSGVSNRNLLYFVVFILSGLFISVMLIKPLNALLLGERYSRNLGVSLTRARIIILFVTGLLTAIVTAFCGPVSFIGLAVPHIARLLLGSSNHRQLLPVTVLLGAVVSLLCNLLTVVIGKGTVIPLNVITPLMGAPVIIYVIVNKKKIAYFN